MLKRILIVCCVFALTAIPSFAAIYDAVTDFPTVNSNSNPVSANGVWAYGFSTGLNPVTFSLDTNAWTGDGNAAGFYTTTSSGNYGTYNLPEVLKNITGGTIPFGVEAGTIGPWQDNLLLLHPGPSGEYSVVQFTAPAAATYVVSGTFVAIGNFSGDTSDSASVTTSGPNSSSTLLYSTTSTTPNSNFSFTQSMTQGQTLDFAVGLGPQGQFYYDSTGFDATISATPEPGFYGLLALSLSGVTIVVSRRKRV